jgi:hypothetical protein
MTIEGRCDERRTTEFSVALGERRAAVMRKFLTKLGAQFNSLNYRFPRRGTVGRRGPRWQCLREEPA